MSTASGRVLVVAAHPDDPEFLAGGTIARLAKEGREIAYVIVTNGNKGSGDRSVTSQQLVPIREEEQRCAARVLGVRGVEFLGYEDGELEDTRAFLGDVVRALRQYRPHTVFVHDPYRMKGFQHRDHRKAGMVTTDAVYPFARDHLHFPEQITREDLEPHKVRELWYWGMDEPGIIVDVTGSIDRQIAALVRHESQMPGFNVPPGETIGQRVKRNAAGHATGYDFEYGAVFRRLIARR